MILYARYEKAEHSSRAVRIVRNQYAHRGKWYLVRARIVIAAAGDNCDHGHDCDHAE